jgi:hypothetical protein
LVYDQYAAGARPAATAGVAAGPPFVAARRWDQRLTPIEFETLHTAAHAT